MIHSLPGWDIFAEGHGNIFIVTRQTQTSFESLGMMGFKIMKRKGFFRHLFLYIKINIHLGKIL